MTADEIKQLEIKNFAKDFVERFGSFSNQTNFENMELLKIKMTPRVRQFADGYVAGIKKDHPYTFGYFGITTQVVASELTYYEPSDNFTTLKLGTVREETAGSETKTYNQDVELELVKVGSVWRVDGIYWIK